MIIEPDSQRKFSRIKFDRYINVEFISDRYENCHIKDLSLAGMFVKGDFQQPEGKYCNIQLVQKGMATELTLQALARVVRKEKDGIGIEFTSMSFDSYLFLQTTLLSEAEDSILLGNLLKEKCPFEVTDELPVSPASSLSL